MPDHSQQEWLDRVRSLLLEDGSMWRMTRALQRNKRQDDDGLIGLEVFASHMEEVFRGNSGTVDLLVHIINAIMSLE